MSSTVYEDQLQRHLKKCNAAKRGTPVCFSANINTGIHDYSPSDEEKKPLSVFPQHQLDDVITRVEKVYQEHKCHMEQIVLEHPVMNSDLSDPSNGVTALKHIRQQASILGHLEKLQLFQPHTCFIEFGAGRGKLSNCLQRACDHDDTVHYLLVDRASCRRKVDVYRRGDPSHEARVERLLIDIEHLDLGKVGSLQREDVRHVVAISKHLCGAATDMTLRCLLETMSKSHDHQEPMGFQDSSDVTLPHHGGPPDAKRSCPAPPPATPSPSPSPSHTNTSSIIPPPPLSLPHTNHHSSPSPILHKLRAIVIALCCHHRCTWSQLAGTEWLCGCGFSPVDVHLITKMTSWAVCGVRGPDKGSHDLDKESHDLDHDNTPFNDSTTNSDSTINSSSVHHVTMTTGSTHHPPSYHPHPREPVGLTCKRLLDLARLHYLKTRGWDGRLVHFVSRGTSLENVLLIATPPTE